MSRSADARAEGLEPTAGLVYGVRVEGHLPVGFEPWLRRLDGPRKASLELTYRTVAALPTGDRIWAAQPTARTMGGLALFREPEGFGLTVARAGSGLFRVTADTIAIEWVPDGAGPAPYFFSFALPLWLEWRGVPVLHASAVSLGDRVIAFLGSSGSGKSTLCAYLVRSGQPFVADDGLPLFEGDGAGWRCAHGPPFFKLWPSALERHLEASAKELPRVQDFQEKRLLACPWSRVVDPEADLQVAAVYVLEASPGEEGGVTIQECTARESLILLLEHSLAGAPLAALGLAAERFERLSRVATRTPVRYLRYPVAGDRWPAAWQAIQADLRGST